MNPSGYGAIVNFIKPDLTLRDDRLLWTSLCLIGLVVLLAINRKPAGKMPQTLEMMIRTFYFRLLGLASNRDSFQSYLKLAPNTMERFSEDEFSDIWKNVEKEIIYAVKYQDSAVCELCNKTSKGLWLPGKYNKFGDPIKAKLFFECPRCKKVYCGKCYAGFQNKHQCPECGEKLGQSKLGVAVMMQENDVKSSPRLYDIQIEKEDDRIAEVVCELMFESTFRRITEPATSYGVAIEPYDLDLGEKGKVICRFHNKAVKIGEKWRLLSADPFAMSVVGLSEDDLEVMLANRRKNQQDKTPGFCTKCGSTLRVSDCFCPKCGEEIKIKLGTDRAFAEDGIVRLDEEIAEIESMISEIRERLSRSFQELAMALEIKGILANRRSSKDDRDAFLQTATIDSCLQEINGLPAEEYENLIREHPESIHLRMMRTNLETINKFEMVLQEKRDELNKHRKIVSDRDRSV